MTVPKAPGWAELVRTGHFAKVLILGFGVWLHAADNLMVSTVSPAMIGEIGGKPYVAWLIALYEVGSIVGGSASALIVLRFGLANAMVGGAAVYCLGCLVSGTGQSMGAVLTGRLLQGTGGGAMLAMAFIGVHQILPERLTTRAYALVSLIWGVSAFAGPVIGALFADAGWWRGAFYFYAVQSVAFALLIFFYLNRTADLLAPLPGSRPKPIPLLLRLSALTGGVIAIAAAGIAGQLIIQLVLGGSGIALIELFLRLDRLATFPLLPKAAAKVTSLEGSALAIIVLMSAATVGLITYGPLILTRIHDLSAFQVGLLLLLESISWSIAALALSGLPPRWERIAVAAGFCMVAGGVVVMLPAIGTGPVWLIALAAALMGGGFGTAWSFMVRRAVELASSGEGERMAAAMPTVQRVGFALGAAIAGIVANASGFALATTDPQMVFSAHWIFGLLIIPALLGLLAVWRFNGYQTAAERVQAASRR